LQNQKKSTVKRLFQPISPALNSHLEEAIVRFRNHRKEVVKEAELCHMIEEKQARDLVLRNNEATKARERGMNWPEKISKKIKSLLLVVKNLIRNRIETEEADFTTIYHRLPIQAPSNAKNPIPWN
jgi:hypothetical protein